MYFFEFFRLCVVFHHVSRCWCSWSEASWTSHFLFAALWSTTGIMCHSIFGDATGWRAPTGTVSELHQRCRRQVTYNYLWCHLSSPRDQLKKDIKLVITVSFVESSWLLAVISSNIQLIRSMCWQGGRLSLLHPPSRWGLSFPMAPVESDVTWRPLP